MRACIRRVNDGVLALRAYIDLLPLQTVGCEGVADAGADERLLVVAWLGGRVDGDEASGQRVLDELLGGILLPGSAVDEGRAADGVKNGVSWARRRHGEMWWDDGWMAVVVEKAADEVISRTDLPRASIPPRVPRPSPVPRHPRQPRPKTIRPPPPGRPLRRRLSPLIRNADVLLHVL